MYHRKDDQINYESLQTSNRLQIHPTNQTLNLIEDQVPVKFIEIKSSGEITLNERALQLINYYNKPVGFVSIIGKCKSGKSFLLNKLLGQKSKGFKVDSSSNLCTQGIWMWSRPFYSSKQDCYLFIIDSAGLGATNKDSEYDDKIFALTILISSYLIFNSIGPISSQNLKQLQAIIRLSKKLDIQQIEIGSINHFPKFLWLIRDSSSQLKDSKGRNLTPNQYLQSCLTQNSSVKNSQNIRNICKKLQQFFPIRQCFTLIKPVLEETEIKNLNTISESKFRKQFIQGIKELKQKILNNATPKMIQGNKLTAATFTDILQSAIETFNQNQIVSTKYVIEDVKVRQGEEAYSSGIIQYKRLWQINFEQDEPKGQQIFFILKQMRDKALQVFNKEIGNSLDPSYRNKLINILIQKQKAIIKVNNELNSARNQQLISQLSKNLKTNIQENKYSSQNSKKLIQDYNEMIMKYNNLAKGSTKCQVLVNYLSNLNPVLINSYTIETTKKMNLHTMNNAVQYPQNKTDNQIELEKIIKNLEQKNRSLQSKVQSRVNPPSEDPKKIKMQSDQIKKLEIENEKIKKQLELAKNANSGNSEGKKGTCCQIF